MKRRVNKSLVGLVAGAALAASVATAFAAPETLQLTPGNMLAQNRSSAVLFDVTFVTRSLQMPNAIFRARVMAKDFLDPAKYPTTHFVGQCTNNGQTLVGNLTMHGETHPFTMAVTDEIVNNALVGLYTEGKLNRYHWGLDGQGLTVGKIITVMDTISLNGQPPKRPH